MGTRSVRASAGVLGLVVLLAALTFASAAVAQPRSAVEGGLARLAVQQTQLTAADGTARNYFGYSVAVSGDTALVGAYGKTEDGHAFQGAAYVFVRSGGGWKQEAKLKASDGAAYDRFGWSVALAGDTALVGAYSKPVDGNADQGAAYVFARSGGEWTQQAKLTGSHGAAGDFFGWSVALDGDTAVVGAYGKALEGQSSRGVAYVFTRSGATWTEQSGLGAFDGAAGDRFGWSVDVSGDTALVGAPYKSGDTHTYQGAAYVFVRSGGSWTQQRKLTAEDGVTNDQFGTSVALDGDTALVGAPRASGSVRMNQGAAYVFTRSGTSWAAQKELIAGDGGAQDQFGTAVALDGDSALVGAPNKSVGGQATPGAAYVYTRVAESWSEVREAPAAGSGINYYGSAIALSNDTAVIGAYYQSFERRPQAGAVYIFQAAGSESGVPDLTRLSSATGKRGATVVIRGAGFGSRRDSSVVRFGKAPVKKYVSWSRTKIKVKVPRAAKLGKLKVTVSTDAGTSNSLVFRVKR